jgi:Ferritin-like domain
MNAKVIQRIVNSPSDRRRFMKQVGAGGIGLAAATTIGGSFLGKVAHAQATGAATTAITDADILNFALNLEYLEAEFYAVSTYGSTLLELGVLTSAEESGPTTGGNMVPNFGSSPLAYLATALRDDEIDHVNYLRQALGSAAVKKPTINLAALGYGFASVDSWLKLARQFEDVGVSAYLGAAPLVTSKTYLAAAAAIMATEAQHSGSIREACIANQVISPAVDTLDVPPTQSTPYDVDKNALSIPRTTAQVLNIVYAGGSCGGGFFPAGMNGMIACQS